jgi:hypothetical protein
MRQQGMVEAISRMRTVSLLLRSQGSVRLTQQQQQQQMQQRVLEMLLLLLLLLVMAASWRMPAAMCRQQWLVC